MVTMNLNTYVNVKLTDYGMEILKTYYKNVNPRNTMIPLTRGQEFTLWELMQIFGPYLYNGNPRIPFEDNVFEFNMKDADK